MRGAVAIVHKGIDMKLRLMFSALLIVGAAGAASAQDKDPATRKMGEESTRTSSFGKLVDKMIKKDDDLGIDAKFEDGDGKIVTKEISARDRFEGVWVTPKGDKECATAQEGSKNWGKIWFKLSDFGRVFTGKWGYCDAEPNEDFKAEWQKK